jgi:hypothetical protein
VPENHHGAAPDNRYGAVVLRTAGAAVPDNRHGAAPEDRHGAAPENRQAQQCPTIASGGAAGAREPPQPSESSAGQQLQGQRTVRGGPAQKSNYGERVTQGSAGAVTC